MLRRRQPRQQHADQRHDDGDLPGRLPLPGPQRPQGEGRHGAGPRGAELRPHVQPGQDLLLALAWGRGALPSGRWRRDPARPPAQRALKPLRIRPLRTQVKALKEGKPVDKPIYNHVTGLLDPAETIQAPKVGGVGAACATRWRRAGRAEPSAQRAALACGSSGCVRAPAVQRCAHATARSHVV